MSLFVVFFLCLGVTQGSREDDENLDKLKALAGRLGNLLPTGDKETDDRDEQSFPKEVRPLPEFEIPYFYYITVPKAVYDRIDYEAVQRDIENTVEGLMIQGMPPQRITAALVPTLYGLRSGCTVNVLQRIINTGLVIWANKGIKDLAMRYISDDSSMGESLINGIKDQVMMEVNRTIFGSEFEDFQGVCKFITRSIGGALYYQTPGIPNMVYNLSRNALQCTRRSTFLQGFVNRIGDLQERIISADAPSFVTRMLLSRGPCDRKPDIDFPEALKVVDGILGEIQESLGQMLSSVIKALVNEDDKPIAEIFANLNSETKLLSYVLSRLRNQPVVDGRPEPVVPNVNNTEYETTGSNVEITPTTPFTPTENPLGQSPQMRESKDSDAELTALLKRLLLSYE